MNKHVKRKWVRALRSGEYTQTTGWLVETRENGFGHCCLGVLACEMVPEFVRKQNATDYEPGVDGRTDVLPDDLAVMFDLGYDDQDTLSNLNDNGQSFDMIADYIEENL